MTFVVRSAQPSDESALIDQFQGLNVHENGITKDRRTDYSAAQESLAAAWQSVRQTDGQVLVAELDGRVIGHLFLLFKIDAVFVERELRPYAYVSELYVREKVRGRGVARALMKRGRAHCKTARSTSYFGWRCGWKQRGRSSVWAARLCALHHRAD